jgi:hypothetical protein
MLVVNMFLQVTYITFINKLGNDTTWNKKIHYMYSNYIIVAIYFDTMLKIIIQNNWHACIVNNQIYYNYCEAGISLCFMTTQLSCQVLKQIPLIV